MTGNNTGNWRNHLLIKCVNCKKPMGYHKFSTNKQCLECEIKARNKKLS